jgi:hypothetical protein
MENTILHSGALVVALDARGHATSAIAGKLPTADEAPRFCEEDDISESDQVYLDHQGEL